MHFTRQNVRVKTSPSSNTKQSRTGSSECLYVVFRGERTFFEYLIRYFAPTLGGNAVGGVLFVAALAHAQHAPAGANI